MTVLIARSRIAAFTPMRHALASVLLCMALAGCHKTKVVATPPPPPPVPPSVVNVPPPTHPSEPEPEIEIVTSPTIPIPTPTPPRRTPRRRPATPPAAPTTTTATTATATPQPVDLGQLTTGGDANNAALRQSTEDLLRAQQKRLINLPLALSALHSEQVERARLFLRDADDAWKKLDLEGARNLATKAKVLLDEVTK